MREDARSRSTVNAVLPCPVLSPFLWFLPRLECRCALVFAFVPAACVRVPRILNFPFRVTDVSSGRCNDLFCSKNEGKVSALPPRQFVPAPLPHCDGACEAQKTRTTFLVTEHPKLRVGPPDLTCHMQMEDATVNEHGTSEEEECEKQRSAADNPA